MRPKSSPPGAASRPSETAAPSGAGSQTISGAGTHAISGRGVGGGGAPPAAPCATSRDAVGGVGRAVGRREGPLVGSGRLVGRRDGRLVGGGFSSGDGAPSDADDTSIAADGGLALDGGGFPPSLAATPDPAPDGLGRRVGGGGDAFGLGLLVGRRVGGALACEDLGLLLPPPPGHVRRDEVHAPLSLSKSWPDPHGMTELTSSASLPPPMRYPL